MKFHAEFFPAELPGKIRHSDHIMLAGSCFTEQIGNKLAQHKFSILQNPNGILFNPVSIGHAIQSYVSGKQYQASDLFYFNELWSSWDHHSRFSNAGQQEVIGMINESQSAAHEFIKKADWLMLTLGSAFVYEATKDKIFESVHREMDHHAVVANCHKVPADKFNRRLMKVEEVVDVLTGAFRSVKNLNPNINFLLTISPVRHLREGFIENNRSKATLIQAVQHLEENKLAHYFPAYELVIDDLRDYRFYAEDLVHPNHAATNYVWDKFLESCIDGASVQLMKEIAVLIAARNHKPFNPSSEQHRKFLASNLEKLQSLANRYPYIDFSQEEEFFKAER